MNEFASVSFFTDSIRSTVDEILCSKEGLIDFKETCDKELIEHVTEISEKYNEKIEKDGNKLKRKDIRNLHSLIDLVIVRKDLFRGIEAISNFFLKLLKFLSEKTWGYKKSFFKLIEFLTN